MLSCKKASELIEKKLLFKLSLQEKLRLNIHTSMCSACKLYEKQSAIIDQALRINFHELEKFSEQKLSSEIKNKIKSDIKNL